MAIVDFTGVEVLLFEDAFKSTKLLKCITRIISESNGTIERIKMGEEKFIRIRLPKGTARGVSASVEIWCSENRKWESDKDKDWKRLIYKNKIFSLPWERIVQYSRFSGEVIERNRYLCTRCLVLSETKSKNGVYFCKECSHTWRNNLGEKIEKEIIDEKGVKSYPFLWF